MGYRRTLAAVFAILCAGGFATPPCFVALDLAGSQAAFREHWIDLGFDFDPPAHVAEFHVNVLMPIFGPELYRRIQMDGRPRGSPQDHWELLHPNGNILWFGSLSSDGVRTKTGPRVDVPGQFVELHFPYRARVFENSESVERILSALRAWAGEDAALLSRIPSDAAAWIASRQGQVLGHDAYVRPTAHWKELPGAALLSSVSRGVSVLHPHDGWITVESYGPDGKFRFRRGSTVHERVEAAGTHVALPGTPATSALLQERAADFAPLSSVALVMLADYFPTTKARPWTSRLPGAGLAERARALRGAIVARGVRRFDPAESLAQRRAFLETALEAYEKYGVDLVRVALGHFSEPRDGQEANAVDFPHLGINLRNWRTASPYANELRGLASDIYETHSAELFRQGIAALAAGLPPADPLLARLQKKIEREASFGRETDHVLTNYYTEGHPNYDGGTDTFTELLKRVREHDTGAAQRLARFAHTQLAARGVDLSAHDLVVHAPGSDRADPRNRAFHLAQAFAAQTQIPFADGAFTLGDSWRPQTTVGGVAQRLTNASRKFESANARVVRGKNVVLVEDANTSGVGLARLRALLYAAGANRVTVVSFAQTVSPGMVPYSGVRSYPPEAFP